MRKILFVSLLVGVLTLLALVNVVGADNGIPGDCEYVGAAYQLPGVFPRYEANNQRLVLVNWNTGEDVRVIETALAAPEFQITGWSPDCRFLTGAIGAADETGLVYWDTVIWDTTISARAGTFEDARRVPYPLTWDPTSAYLLVETRNGALVWNIVSGSRVQLTSEADGAAHSFRPGSVQWDLGSGQLHAVLAITPFGASVTYNLQTGELVSIINRFGDAVPTDAPGVQLAQVSDEGFYGCSLSGYRGHAPHNLRAVYQSYNRSIVLLEESTREVVHMLETDVETPRFQTISWSPECRYLAGSYGTRRDVQIVIWDATTGDRMGVFSDLVGYTPYLNWDPRGEYTVFRTRHGYFLWHIPSGLQAQLTTDYGGLYDLEWDYENGQLRGTRPTGIVAVYSLETGERLNPLDDSQPYIGFGGVGRFPFAVVDGLYGCIFNQRGWFQPTYVYPRYSRPAQRFVLEDRSTREIVQVIEESLMTSRFRVLSWSPDCRFVAAALGPTSDMDTVIWDITTNARVAVFENAQQHPHRLSWDPSGSFVLVETRNGGYLLNLDTGERMLMNTNADDDGLNFHHIGWDIANWQLLTVPIGAGNTVAAFDLQSGQQIATYHNAERAAPVNFVLSPDNRYLLLYTSEWEARDERPYGLALWDRTTQTGVQLTMEPYINPYYSNTAFSGDGRYLVIAGSTSIFIWDMSGLAGDGPHLPHYIHPVASTQRPHFVGEHILQTSWISTDRFQLARRNYTFTTYDWDVRTGELVSEIAETRDYFGDYPDEGGPW
jgi:WD40 repeat protein